MQVCFIRNQALLDFQLIVLKTFFLLKEFIFENSQVDRDGVHRVSLRAVPEVGFRLGLLGLRELCDHFSVG